VSFRTPCRTDNDFETTGAVPFPMDILEIPVGRHEAVAEPTRPLSGCVCDSRALLSISRYHKR